MPTDRSVVVSYAMSPIGSIPSVPFSMPPAVRLPAAPGVRADTAAPMAAPLQLTDPSKPAAPRSFTAVLDRLVEEVAEKQGAAAAASRQILAGENVPLHQAVIAGEEAAIAFQLMVEVRNKLLEAYQELMRMQV